ncbi:MAG: universal stress protein [Cyclobacteriaceae bacterium]|nr:universal stress protein [Cyclobacteriaceae bacterium]
MKQLTYLVPVDFSPCSLNALQYATMLARHAEGKIVLSHVVDLEEVPESDNPVVVTWNLDRLSRTAQEKMKSLREMIALEGIPVEEDIAFGNVKNGVVKQIEQIKPTVIVLGRNTDSQPDKNSMVTHISKNTRVPVLVVPGSHNPRVPNKALLATDMKPFGLKDFALLMNIIRKTALQLAVLNVKNNTANGAHASAWVEKLNTTYDIEASLVTTNKPQFEKSVEEAVRENKVDFLFAIRHEGIFDRIFNNDPLPFPVQAGVPVLLVRR